MMRQFTTGDGTADNFQLCSRRAVHFFNEKLFTVQRQSADPVQSKEESITNNDVFGCLRLLPFILDHFCLDLLAHHRPIPFYFEHLNRFTDLFD